MEISNEKIQAVKEAFAAQYSDRNNVEIVEISPEKIQSVAAEVGQRNNTALGNGEIAEFFSAEDYATKPDYIQIVETTSSNGRVYANLYALVNRYYKSGQVKVGEHLAYINVGGIVRYHFDLQGQTPDAEGKVMNAVRVLNTDNFNVKLESFKLPWEMLTKCLAGKKITAKRSDDKLWHQRFTAARQPIRDCYVEQNYMLYSELK